MKPSDIRAKSDEELAKELLDLNREAFNLRMQMGTGQLSRTNEVRKVRRDIARVKTIMRQRKTD